MTKRQALRIAAECIAESMKPLAGNANRWILGPQEWASEEKYNRYQQLAKAMRVIEDEILGQGVMEI